MKSFLQGLGIGAGIGTALRGEERPVIRKRRLTKLVYFISLLWGAGAAFFSKPEQHVFSRLMETVGSPGIYPWMFTYMSISFALLLIALAFFLSADSPERPVADLGWFGDLIAMLGLAVFMYAFTYDAAWFWWGGIFAKGAEVFAAGAALVYIMRELTGVLPGERAVKQCFGTTVKEITRDGVYPTPGAPIPHTLYAFIQYANETLPLLWHIYIYPDGRERAVQFHPPAN